MTTNGAPLELEAQDAVAPLVVGVVGHRELRTEDRPALVDAVRSIFERLKKDYPSTPIVVLSSLANGADRLVAEVALEPPIAASLVAPLPMPQVLYEQDFTEASRQEFCTFLRRARHVVPLPLLPGASEDDVSVQNSDARNRQYEQVGIYIVRECQILIALWDGLDSGLVGGTAQVVRFQVDGLPAASLDEALDPQESSPVKHVMTPRPGQPPGDPAGKITPLYPKAFGSDEARAEQYYREMFGRLETFNARVKAGGARLVVEARRNRDGLCPPATLATLPAPLQQMANRYAFTDSLAIRYASATRWASIAVHVMVLLAFAAFLAYGHLPGPGAELPHAPGWLFASLSLLGGAMAVYFTARIQGFARSYEDYRAVAEALRIGFFWTVAGVPERLASIYLRKQRTELDWIRNGIRGWFLDLSDPLQVTVLPPVALAIVRAHWIEAQRQFFRGAAHRSHHDGDRLERVPKVTTVIGIGLALTLAVIAWRVPHEVVAAGHWHAWFIIAIDLVLGTGALVHHYSHLRANHEHAKQYERMAGIFERAGTLVEAPEMARTAEAMRRLVERVGREALIENGDWVLLHRDRPLQMPHP